jgi:hypothetical protein
LIELDAAGAAPAGTDKMLAAKQHDPAGTAAGICYICLIHTDETGTAPAAAGATLGKKLRQSNILLQAQQQGVSYICLINMEY